MTDVQVVSELDTIDRFSLTLANPYPELPWTHTDKASAFAEGNGITIRMGYVGRLRDLFDGEITAIAPAFPESGGPTVRIDGYTRLHWLERGAKTRTFLQKTDKEIVQKVAQENNLTPSGAPKGPKYPYVFQYNQTDLAFLLERARRIRHEITIDKQKNLVFTKAKDDEQKAYTLAWGNPQQATAPNGQVLPLRSFNPTLNTRKPLTKVEVRGLDRKSRKLIIGRAGAGDEDAKKGKKTGAAVAKGAGRDAAKIVVNVPVDSKEEADALARAVYNRQLLEFLVATGSSIGLPELRAGRIVEIAGLGPRFSGEYYVTQVTHTISGAGYATAFRARKGGIG